MVQVTGTNRNDTFTATAADEQFSLGNGFDTVIYESDVTVNLLDPSQNTGDAAGDTFTSVERFILRGADGNTFIGDARANTVIARGGDDMISGGAGNDNLRGNNGDDTLEGGAGVDALSGGAGNDTFIVNNADQGDRIDGFRGTDTLRFAGDDTFDPTLFNATSIELFDLGSQDGATLILGQLTDLDAVTSASGADDLVQITGASDFNLSLIADAGRVGVERIEFTDTLGATFEVAIDADQNIIVVDKQTVNSSSIDSIIDTYDLTTENLTARTVNYADGLQANAVFGADGNIDSRVLTDVDGVRDFSTKTTQYDDNGLRIRTTTVFDEGRNAGNERVELFVDGTRVQSTLSDLNNDENFIFIDDQFDSNTGLRLLRTTTRDDGTVILEGGVQDNVIISTSSDDVIAGGNGTDLFVFRDGTGDDTIRDFDASNEQLDLGAYGINSTDDLAGISQDGRSLVLDLDGDNSITLIDVDLADFSDSNFVQNSILFT